MDATPDELYAQGRRGDAPQYPIAYADPVEKASHAMDPKVGSYVAGVEHVLRCLLAEADLIMAVDGYPSLADLTPAALRRR